RRDSRVPAREAGARRRSGPSTQRPVTRSARAITNARIPVTPAAMTSGSFIGVTITEQHACRAARPCGTVVTPFGYARSHARPASPARLDAHAAFDDNCESDNCVDIAERSILCDIHFSVQGGKYPGTQEDFARHARLPERTGTRQSLPSPASWRQPRRHHAQNRRREMYRRVRRRFSRRQSSDNSGGPRVAITDRLDARNRLTSCSGIDRSDLDTADVFGALKRFWSWAGEPLASGSARRASSLPRSGKSAACDAPLHR